MKTNSVQKNVPDGWNLIPAGDVFTFVKSYSFSRENLLNDTSNNRGVGNIHYGDIHSTFSSARIDLKKVSVPMIKDGNFMPKTENLLKDGDLIMADASEDYEGVGVTISVHGLGSKKVVGGLHTFVLRDSKNKTDTYFRQYIFRNPIIRNSLQKVANGVSVYGISKTAVSRLLLPIPSITEQNRIVAVLEVWDKAIEKLDKKLEIKQKIKKGLMQQLLTGKKRLSGFTDDWKVKKLGEIGEIITGNTPPMKDPKNYNGPYCWATAEDFKSKYILNTAITLSEVGKSKSRFLPIGSILVTCIASLGKNAIAGVPLATNQQINAVIVNNKNNNEFIYYYIENSINLLKRMAGSGAVSILNKSEFAKLKVMIPQSKDEQTAIARIMAVTDDEIEKLEKKLLIMNAQKRYLLNSLITGVIRTPENLKIN